MVNMVLWSILKTSWVVSIIILFILLLRKVMGTRMSTKSRQLIWGIILLRLLLPVGPECPISLMNWIPTPDQFIQTILKQNEYTNADYFAKAQNVAYTKKDAAPEENTVDKFYMQDIFIRDSENQGIKSFTQTEASSKLTTIIFFAWSLGCLSFLGISALSVMRFRHINKALEVHPGIETLKELHYCKEKLRIYQNIPLMLLPKLNSPVLTGIYHSKVYLPENLIEQISSDELRYILMHELVHWKRKDILWNLILILALSIHWFNPLVWIASQRIKEDWEMCCDAKVLEIIGKEKADSYGNAILQIVKFQNRQLKGALYQTAFFANKKQTKRRIIMINKFHNGITNKMTGLALVLCIILGMATLTDAPSYAEKNTYNYSTPSNFQLYDPSYQYFDTLDQFCRYADFSFQLPNYLPTIFEVYDYRINRDDNKSYMTVNYWYNTMGGAMVKGAKEEHFQLKISKTNLLELLAPQLTEAQKQKNNFIVSYKSTPKVFAGISGTQLTVMTKDKDGHPSGGDNIYKEDKNQYFIWEKQGVWYAMEYLTQITMEKRSYYLLNLSEGEVSQVIHSFTDPDKITHTGYFIKEEMPSFAVYDENDLKRITRDWNFSPKLPMELPGLKAKTAHMSHAFYGNKEFGVFQISYVSDENSSSEVIAQYEQATQPAIYDDVVKKYQEQQKETVKNNENAYTLQLIKNTKVYCLEEKKDSAQEMHYFWDTGSLSIKGKTDEHIKILNAIIN
ncbi:MAG: M56 family metallopeptidase [Aminipila sp.]